MSDVQSKIVNVIETTQNDEIKYFTLEGLLIGGFKGGTRVVPTEPEPKKEKPNGGIVTPISPHQVERQKQKEIEKMQTPEGRLKHLKEDVA